MVLMRPLGRQENKELQLHSSPGSAPEINSSVVNTSHPSPGWPPSPLEGGMELGKERVALSAGQGRPGLAGLGIKGSWDWHKALQFSIR